MREKIAMKRERVDKLFNFRPFLFGAIFFAFGVVFSLYYHFQGLHAAWLLCVLPLSIIPFLFCFTVNNWIKVGYGALALCVCFLIGFFGFFVQFNRYQKIEGSDDCYFTGKVVELREGYAEIGVVLDDLTVDGKAYSCKLIAYLPTSFCENIGLSDILFLHGDVEKIEMKSESFSRQAKEFGNRVFLTSDRPEGRKTGHTFDLFLTLNALARQVIDAGMDKTPAAVTKGVLLGDTAGIESGLCENIRYGGVAHIFAVSGLHVGSLFAFCLLLIGKTGLKRAPATLRFLFTASVLLLYAGICAFTPSVVRASVMCLVGYMCKLFLVKSDFLESLGISAIVIMLFNPSALFTAGFQLSFAACFGIAFLAKPIGHVFDEVAKWYRYFFPQEPTPAEVEAMKNGDTLPPRLTTRAYRAVASFLSVSLGAQIFTAPFLLYYFGYVSGWALLLNCIFVPLISGIFSLLLLTVALSCLLPLPCSTFLLFAPNALWSLVLLLFEMVDFTSFALSGFKISVSLTVAYLIGTLFCTDKWNVNKWLRFVLVLACFCAFGVGMYALNV